MNEEPSEREYSTPDSDAAKPETTRPADGSDQKPPMIAPNRGPMDQTTPDVSTGSTPLTRHDD